MVDDLDQEILDRLRRGPASSTEVAAHLDVSRQAAHRRLKKLLDTGIIEKQRFTEDYEFTRTRIVIELFAIGVRFVSRSEAKRLVNGLDKFKEVILDFKGVEKVGQGFADEVFRVWATDHPGVRVIPVNMNDVVRFMIERARR